jgi:Zn-dependent peptidase ImmA (M78 family)/DNA-binding XRE family transcriptional regulator
MARKSAPVTPSVLAWARELAGYSQEEAASHLDVSAATLAAWEREDDLALPSFAQLQKVARLYSRPLAIFFFPAPPDEDLPSKTFRTLPDVDELEPDTLLAVREARARQLAVTELFGTANPAERFLLRNVRPAAQESAAQLTQRVREYIGLTEDTQLEWKSAEAGFAHCRNLIERVGIFVFKRSFEQLDVSGFCLTHDEFPLIYVNNSHVFERQLFTLFHELGHLLYDVSGVTTADDAHMDQLSISDQRLEIKCNAFAGELLVPRKALRAMVAAEGTDAGAVKTIASRLHVSREVIIRRMVDLNLIPASEYDARIGPKGPAFSRHNEGSGGNYYRTQVAYLGQHFLREAFSRHRAGLISDAQLAMCTGVKARNLAKLEDFVQDEG